MCAAFWDFAYFGKTLHSLPTIPLGCSTSTQSIDTTLGTLTAHSGGHDPGVDEYTHPVLFRLHHVSPVVAEVTRVEPDQTV